MGDFCSQCGKKIKVYSKKEWHKASESLERIAQKKEAELEEDSGEQKQFFEIIAPPTNLKLIPKENFLINFILKTTFILNKFWDKIFNKLRIFFLFITKDL